MTMAARRLRQIIEPYHALTSFAPECAQAFEAVGLRGFWRGYFAGRAAQRIVDHDVIRYPNPIGAPRPGSRR